MLWLSRRGYTTSDNGLFVGTDGAKKAFWCAFRELDLEFKEQGLLHKERVVLLAVVEVVLCIRVDASRISA